MDTYNRSIIGLKSRSNGEYFERMIMAASRFYEDRGIAVIDKTPEAFKVIKPYNRDRGQFICCFTQQVQPDFYLLVDVDDIQRQMNALENEVHCMKKVEARRRWRYGRKRY